MTDGPLRELAEAAGLHVEWRDAAGEDKTVEVDAIRGVLDALGFPNRTDGDIRDSRARSDDLQARRARQLVTAVAGEGVSLPGTEGPLRLMTAGGERVEVSTEAEGDRIRLQAPAEPGYYRQEDGELTIAVAPSRAWTVADAAPGRRVWGAAAQLYALRGRRSGPFGDFEALADFAHALGRCGGDALAISPVHALFAADPARFGPYAPSSRLFLNVLFAPAAEPLDAGSELIDWPVAGAAKLQALRTRFERARGTAEERAGLQAFEARGGEALVRHARFEALSARFRPETGSAGWRSWPSAFHDPAGEAVEAFAREHSGEVAFHVWLQKRAAEGLAAAQAEAKAAGMAVGLIADLAVGVDPDGAQVWSDRGSFLDGLSIGAPPDIFQPAGQDWGLTTFHPHAFHQGGWRGFTAGLAGALSRAGGVRIDHAMGLQRLWLTPHGARPTEGAYVDYPFRDMLRLIALESWLAKGIVVGEDLGTVPEGFRETTTAAGMYGMRVLPFERREDESFVPPGEWSPDAMAMTSTHDLPTVVGWWEARDIDWMERLDRRGRHAGAAEERAARETDRERLWRACREAGVAEGPQPPPSGAQAAADAAVAYAARSGCALAVLPLEDLLGLEEQPNHPGTTDEAPNWRRRLAADPDTELDAPRVAARIAGLNRERPRTPSAPETRP